MLQHYFQIDLILSFSNWLIFRWVFQRRGIGADNILRYQQYLQLLRQQPADISKYHSNIKSTLRIILQHNNIFNQNTSSTFESCYLNSEALLPRRLPSKQVKWNCEPISQNRNSSTLTMRIENIIRVKTKYSNNNKF